MAEDKTNKKGGIGTAGSDYGKRPLWQWIVIYLIIAIIVYGLIYYFFLGGGY